ncbi:hypothetical protein N7541_007220 [Penicillium brevicompactum]|uniref:PNPLA domain-containing protein n=1 Tax=Penicillium brevicompactum TaxID=5074 RepID=A0A9W9ULI2_PENBR|nr:hypothetical protein N7541_007220 [Penicillium brevicompactum]
MSQLNAERDDNQVLKPCDVFDLIGGTSTGGLIAIMLGRLEMGIDECICAYTELMESVFGEKVHNLPIDWAGNIVPQYDSKKLKVAIEEVISRAGLSPEDPMDYGSSGRCRMFVCTTAKETLQVTRLRSYKISSEGTVSATICEAALATSAATGFFDPVRIGNREFVDGAFGANNPIEEIEEEATDIWCNETRELRPLVKCILSIGTGSPARVPVDNKMLKFLSQTLVRMATKPESTERRFMARWCNQSNTQRYFRFNVEQGLQGVHMNEYQKRSVIESATHAYLHNSGQKSSVQGCISNLLSKQGRTNVNFEDVLREHEARVAQSRILRAIGSSGKPFLSDKSSCWEVPFDRNSRYVDHHITVKIKRRLFTTCHSERIALFGLGGVGKTQIVLELAYQIRELYSDCSVFWVPAMDTESTHQAYQRIADQVGINTSDTQGEDVKVLVQKHLSQPESGRWLLIFDNADDHDLWSETKDLPVSNQGVILFTTRSHKIARLLAAEDVIQITEMDEQNAIQVLRNSLTRKELLEDVDVTRQFLDRLTYLPLAIVQAASFINENMTSIEAYVRLLDCQEQSAIDLLSEDFEDEGRYKSIRNPVATTWLTSFHQIHQKHPLASQYLMQMGCMASEDIPTCFLGKSNALEREKAIGVLVSYSFVRVQQSETTLSMHRLVHLAMRNWLRSGIYLQAWKQWVLKHISENFPEPDRLHRGPWRAAMPHALYILDTTSDEEPGSHRVWLLNQVGSCQLLDGRIEESFALLKECVEIAEIICDPDDELLVHTLRSLTRYHLDQKNTKEAVVLLERLTKITAKVYGPDHFMTARANLEMGSLLSLKGEYSKSEELCTQSIKCFLQELGPRSFETIEAAGCLLNLYIFQGRLSDAAELAPLVLEMSKATLGSDHPQTAVHASQLGNVYTQLWRLDEAEALYTTALEINKQVLGSEHRHTVLNMKYLAETWAFQGRRNEAIDLMTECARLFSQVHGPEHIHTKKALGTVEEWSSPK